MMIDFSSTFIEADFRKSSASEPTLECVHVARRGARVALRDSKTAFGGPQDGWLVLTADRFATFLAQYRE